MTGATGPAGAEGKGRADESDGPGWVLPALLSAALLLLLRPDLLVLPTTPSGYDLGAHILLLREMSERLLPDGRIHGWSQAWFAGEPLFYFYFPLPAVLAAGLDVALPFEVAVKVMSVTGLLLTPLAAWVFVRGLGMRGWAAGLVATGAALYLFQESSVHLGGNARATLAGEFAYGLGFPLALAYLGVVAAAARGGRRRPVLAALLLAGCALSHVVPAVAAVAGSALLLFGRRARSTVAFSWTAGFLLSAPWSVPFLVRRPAMPDVPWTEAVTLLDVLPPEVWPLVPAALVGVVMAVRSDASPLRRRAFLTVAGAVASAFLLLALAPSGGTRLRLMPFWIFSLHLLAAWPLGVVMEGARAGRMPERRRRPAIAVALVLSVGGLTWTQAGRSPGELREWATWNYEGYEGKARWPEFQEFLGTVSGLPPGRVHWEDHPYIQGWGTPHAPAILPMWSPDHPVLGGLWRPFRPTAAALVARRETSTGLFSEEWYRPADVAVADFERGMRHLRLLGVRWFVGFSREGVEAALAVEGARAAAGLPFATVVELPGTGLVEAAARTPVPASSDDRATVPVRVWEGDAPFTEAARAWFLEADERTPWLAEDGPAGWTRTDVVPRSTPVRPAETAGEVAEPSGDPALGTAGPGDSAGGAASPVSGVVLEPEEIRFHTTEVGVPHLVRVSWFPNWRAEGARGPWRVAPSFMVVVPTRQEVSLVFGPTRVERTAAGLGVLGLLLVLGAAVGSARNASPSPFVQ